MAQSRSTPSRKMAPVETRVRFTLEQANRSLPYVGRIVRDIVRTHEAAAAVKAAAATAASEDKPAILARLESTVERLGTLDHELRTAGVELKDPGTGLVDFMSRHNGRDIHLCWKLGDDHITRFHETGADFDDSKPIERLAAME